MVTMINSFRNIYISWFVCFIVFFFCVKMSVGSSVKLSIPKNYDPASSLSDALYKEGELIVRFDSNVVDIKRNVDKRSAILTNIGGTVRHTYKRVPGLSVVKLPVGVKVEDVITEFNKTKGILYAQPNYLLSPLLNIPDDPNFSNLWGMHNTGQTGGTEDADIDAPEAWDIATNTDVVVAVIDTGVDYNHPDLANNMWTNEAELNGIAGVDDDNNGYVDDIYGYDFSTWGYKDRDSDPNDGLGHGTHCAGTIGAIGNNTEGVTGVCWNVKIISLQFIC